MAKSEIRDAYDIISEAQWKLEGLSNIALSLAENKGTLIEPNAVEILGVDMWDIAQSLSECMRHMEAARSELEPAG